MNITKGRLSAALIGDAAIEGTSEIIDVQVIAKMIQDGKLDLVTTLRCCYFAGHSTCITNMTENYSEDNSLPEYAEGFF